MISFNTILGQVELPSVYLWKKGQGVRPLKERMGITHQGRSEAVSRALSDFGSEESFGQAAKRFTEHYKYEINAGTVLRETENTADEALEYVERKLSEAGKTYGEAVISSHGCDEMLTEPDGCELRTAVLKDTDSGKRKKVINWREVRIGPVRDMGSVSKIYVGKMCGYPEIVGQLFSAAVLAGMNPNTKVTGVGDGGIGLKEEPEVQFPNIQFIPDKVHLKDHLFDTAEALGISEKERGGWVKSRLERISRGEADQVKAEFESEYENRGNNRVKRLIGYLSRFSGCMDYDEFKERGCPIGSGEVESAHRSVPQKRLKLPGACWHPGSVNPMLALRVLRANDWWNNFWKERTEKLLLA